MRVDMAAGSARGRRRIKQIRDKARLASYLVCTLLSGCRLNERYGLVSATIPYNFHATRNRSGQYRRKEPWPQIKYGSSPALAADWAWISPRRLWLAAKKSSPPAAILTKSPRPSENPPACWL